MIVVPGWLVLGVSEISAVCRFAERIPSILRASITLFMRLAFAASAPWAVRALVDTPKLNAAWLGTVVTMPAPVTVMVLGVAADASAVDTAAANDAAMINARFMLVSCGERGLDKAEQGRARRAALTDRPRPSTCARAAHDGSTAGRRSFIDAAE